VLTYVNTLFDRVQGLVVSDGKVDAVEAEIMFRSLLGRQYLDPS